MYSTIAVPMNARSWSIWPWQYCVGSYMFYTAMDHIYLFLIYINDLFCEIKLRGITNMTFIITV